MRKPRFTSAEIEKLTGVKLEKPNVSKYRSTKVKSSRGNFDSKKEFIRYLELESLQKFGTISQLKRQVRFELVPEQVINGKTVRGVYYDSDFTYKRDGKFIVEDVKGMRTRVYAMKRKMMKQVHNIEILET